MRAQTRQVLSASVRRSLATLGSDIRVARKKRRLTVAMMCERIGITDKTYSRVERGDAGVSLGIYAMTLFVLGLGTPFADLASPGRDERALVLDEERLPERIRIPRPRS